MPVILLVDSNFRMFRLALSSLILLPAVALATPPPMNAAASRQALEPFVEQNCLACHNGAAKLGGLDLSSLPLDNEDPAAFTRWVRVRDRVEDGEMPPQGAPRPDDAAARAFVDKVDEVLMALAQPARDQRGRVVARRLTRTQYQNTVQELLGVAVPLLSYLPHDGQGETFDTVAAGQQMSHFLLEKYLDAGDAALDAAFEKATAAPPSTRRDFTIAELTRSGPRSREPEGYGDHVVSWSTPQVFYGRMLKTAVDESGWRRIRVTASAINPPENGRLWTMLRHGVGYARAPAMYYIGAMELTRQPREHVFDAWLDRGHLLEIRPHDATLPQVAGNRLFDYKPGQGEAEGLPGARIMALSMERIFPGGTVEQTQQALFGEYGAEPDDPETALEALMLSFAERAFRRPVQPAEISGYVGLAKRDLNLGFPTALRGGYRALLCSPRFLYFVESPGPLDDFAVAARLSYFLWDSAPDAELRAAAASGALDDFRGRRKQVERMLADERSQRFVRGFLAQWLNLNEIDFTQPDQKLYPEIDEILKYSMVAETELFFRKLLDEDLSVANVVDSDFAVINSRLAKHYGLPDPEEFGFATVALPGDSPRGGLLTQGSVLKVTANGTTTSPVVRGAFVTERILGKEVPPPPPGVPAVEPDIRGAQTIREQLALHRDYPACAGCHQRIDPPGFALESFDPIGGFRERYRVLPPDDADGDARKWVHGPRVDPGYELLSGETFRNIEGLKSLFKVDREQIARNLAGQLLTYGTGARVEYADRPEIERIVARAADNDYGLKSLLFAVVDNPLFLSK
jgi:mono/diheme cytochrome c family protein